MRSLEGEDVYRARSRILFTGRKFRYHVFRYGLGYRNSNGQLHHFVVMYLVEYHANLHALTKFCRRIGNYRQRMPYLCSSSSVRCQNLVTMHIQKTPALLNLQEGRSRIKNCDAILEYRYCIWHMVLPICQAFHQSSLYPTAPKRTWHYVSYLDIKRKTRIGLSFHLL